MAWVAPSLLAADFAELGRAVRTMEEAGARLLHIDVMDGHFVPNLTVGIPVLEALRPRTSLILDVHLMIANPEAMAESFVEAGADYLTVHYETVTHLDRLLERIREKGALPGVALNPHSPTGLLEEIAGRCHHILIMSVNPGFGGQRFIAGSYKKVRKVRSWLQARNLDVKIEIDGGIDLGTIEEAVRNGVDIAVAGSAIFHSQDPKEAFRELQERADRAAYSAREAPVTRNHETFSI